TAAWRRAHAADGRPAGRSGVRRGRGRKERHAGQGHIRGFRAAAGGGGRRGPNAGLREGKPMNGNTIHRSLLAASVALALCGFATTALADDALQEDGGQAPPPASSERASTLDTLIVTPQKREEALQHVPITLSVLPEQLRTGAAAHDIKQLRHLVSGRGLSSAASESQAAARLRGIGAGGDTPGLGSSVGVVIDGVYRPRNGVGFGDLGPVERVEVLKG